MSMETLQILLIWMHSLARKPIRREIASMKPSSAISNNRVAIRALMIEHGLLNPGGFGSVSRHEDTDASDLVSWLIQSQAPRYWTLPSFNLVWKSNWACMWMYSPQRLCPRAFVIKSLGTPSPYDCVE